ncbi:MAG TPA: ABC transporter permease, partial [Tepidiformaceae bacterium]|nr:ABC transporter permease [Tepidiformaceae bacterium]
MRTGLLIAVLAVSMGLVLTMITVNSAFAKRLDEIKSEVGTDVTVRPAGSFGGGAFAIRFGPGGPGAQDEVQGDASDDDATTPTLTQDQLNQLAGIEHASGITRTLTAMYSDGEIESGIDFGGGGIQVRGEDGETQTFTPPIVTTGTDNPEKLSSFGVESATIVEGRTFTTDELDANVAVMGDALAEANDLSVGDTFTFKGEEFTLIGLYDTGTQFGDNSIFLPLTTTQRLFDRVGEIDQAVVSADSVDNTEAVAQAIRETLGEDVVDVTTGANQFESISAPVSDAKSSSQIGLYSSLIASAAIILFAVALVARQRIKEIGILKAVGASNWHITGQFGLEAGMLSVVAALIGAAATFPLAQKVADGLVAEPAAPSGLARLGPNGDVGFTVSSVGDGPLRTLGATDTSTFDAISVAVSPEVFLYALGIGVGLAIIASLVPAWYAGRVRPAEVLRYE